MKIKLGLSTHEFDLFLNTIQFHKDTLQRVLNWVNDEMKHVEDNWYDKSQEIDILEMCQKSLDEIKNCNNFFNKVKGNNGIDEFDITNEEYDEMLKFIVEQIYHAKNRINDFKEDRFGWGISACNGLIDNETSYINVLNKVFDKYKGNNTYELILEQLS